jgi:hypothetical protein
MPPDPAKLTLVQLAEQRLRTLFPKHFPHMIKPQAPPQVAATDGESKNHCAKMPSDTVEPPPAAPPEVVVVTNARCGVRGCAFPVKIEGWCRTHYLDAHSDHSVMPSLTGAAINAVQCLARL